MQTTTQAAWGTRHSDPIQDELMAQQEFTSLGWFPKSGLEPRWPLTTDELAQILTLAGEYEIDAEGIQELLARRIIPRPSLNDAGDELEWNAFDVMQVAGALEGRRQWRYPSMHSPKRHPCDLVVAAAREDGTLDAILNSPPTVPRFDLQSLFTMILACDSREGREKCGALLKVELEVTHGVMII